MRIVLQDVVVELDRSQERAVLSQILRQIVSSHLDVLLTSARLFDRSLEDVHSILLKQVESEVELIRNEMLQLAEESISRLKEAPNSDDVPF